MVVVGGAPGNRGKCHSVVSQGQRVTLKLQVLTSYHVKKEDGKLHLPLLPEHCDAISEVPLHRTSTARQAHTIEEQPKALRGVRRQNRLFLHVISCLTNWCP